MSDPSVNNPQQGPVEQPEQQQYQQQTSQQQPQYAQQAPQYTQQPYTQPYAQGAPQYQQQYPYQPMQDPTDTGSAGWGVLGFFIPLVGLILYLVWRQNKPRNAKSSGIGAIIGVVFSILFSVAISIIGATLFATHSDELTNGDSDSYEYSYDSSDSNSQVRDRSDYQMMNRQHRYMGSDDASRNRPDYKTMDQHHRYMNRHMDSNYSYCRRSDYPGMMGLSQSSSNEESSTFILSDFKADGSFTTTLAA